MLFSAGIHIFTEHKNLMFDILKTQCVLCWCTKIEQFLSLNVIGPCNILGRHIHSRLHHLITLAQIAVGKKLVEPTEVSNEEEDEVHFLDQEYSDLYDDKVWECIECYLNLPETSHSDQNLLNYAHICELQQQDEQLFALQVNSSDN
jgi:hypothetical protein